jgi:hypothetical protein
MLVAPTGGWERGSKPAKPHGQRERGVLRFGNDAAAPFDCAQDSAPALRSPRLRSLRPATAGSGQAGQVAQGRLYGSAEIDPKSAHSAQYV